MFVLADCGGGDTPAAAQRAHGKIERLTVRGPPSVLIRPAQRTPRVVVYTHGSAERVENIFRDPRNEPVFNGLLNAGHAIATTDAHRDNWGSLASERDQLALVAALRGRGLRDVYVLAFPMGGLNGLQLLERRRREGVGRGSSRRVRRRGGRPRRDATRG